MQGRGGRERGSRNYNYSAISLQGAEPSLDFKQASITCQEAALSTEDFECIKLVHGEAGMCLHTYDHTTLDILKFA